MMRMYTMFVLLVSLGLAGAAQASDMFQFNGKTYKESDLEVKYQLQAFEVDFEQFKNKERLIDEVILNLHFADLAKKKNKSVEDVKKDALNVPEPSESDLKKFYEENKARIPYPYDQVKADLGRFVKEQKMGEVRNKLVAKIKKDGKFAMMLKEPIAPEVKLNVEGFVTRGNPDAKVTLVEFADFKCPHCREASKVLKGIYKKYEKNVKFVYVDFPIGGDLSMSVMTGANCAAKQNKYWEYHEMAFENQSKLSLTSAEEFAGKLKLDMTKFKACTGSPDGKSLAEKGKVEGERIGVTGTPTFYINGRRALIGHSEDDIAKALDKALKEAGARS